MSTDTEKLTEREKLAGVIALRLSWRSLHWFTMKRRGGMSTVVIHDDVAPELAEAIEAAGWVSPETLDEKVREAKIEALRETKTALNTEGVSLKPGGWGGNPADQQTLDFALAVQQWLSDRADRIEAGDPS